MSDHVPTVIVVSGRPGSGKTTLARSIGDWLHLPVVGRDVIKTGMHATSDIDQPSDTRRFSEASYQATYDLVRLLLSRGVSLIVESAFHAEFAEAPLRALTADSHVVHLRTHAATDVSVDRYVRRHLSGERHVAHDDDEFIERATSEVGIGRWRAERAVARARPTQKPRDRRSRRRSCGHHRVVLFLGLHDLSRATSVVEAAASIAASFRRPVLIADTILANRFNRFQHPQRVDEVGSTGTARFLSRSTISGRSLTATGFG